MEAASAISPWQPSAGGSLPPTGLKPPSPSHQGRESASPVESASSSQQSLFAGFPSNDPSHGAFKDGTSPAQQLRNLQRLYGLAHVHQQASRTSLPDIAEEEPSSEQQSLQQTSSMPGLAGADKPATKVMSEDDIFAMGGGLEMRSSSPLSGAESLGAAQGQGSLGQAGAPPLAYDLSLVGQMPAGQSQSRTLFVRKVDASFSEEELHAVFEAFGEIHSIYTACKHRGFVVISYYDIRAATLANFTLQGAQLKGRALELHFSLPKDEKESRQGVVLVVCINASLQQQELLYCFSQYGDVKSVEQDTSRPNCFFVEFYDVRHAAAAMQGITQAPEMSSKMLVMDAAATVPTLPASTSTPTIPTSQAASSGGLLGTSLPSELLSGLQLPGGMKSVGSSPALLQQLQYGSQNSFASAPPASQSMSQLDIATYLLGNGGTGLGGSLGQLAAQQAGSMPPGMVSGSMGDMAGMARSFSELSLQSDLNRVGVVGGGAAQFAGPSGRLGASAMSTGDLLALQQQQQQQQQQSMGRGGGTSGLRGTASTGSIWSSATQQVFTNNAGSLGSSPVSNGPWINALGGLGGSSSALQEALAQQQAALQQQAMNAALLQNAAAIQAAAAGQGPLSQSAAMHALQQALINQQAAALLQSGALGMGQAGPFLQQQQRQPMRIDPPLGGRLARRPMDPHAEAERRAQQEKLYSLDLMRIRNGDDKRTTLMIKNIPNKYTQKMLLALIEERFRGMFDFFYLPIDFKNKCNVGYAFINMIKPEYIIPLVEEFHGKRWPKFNSEKICNIAYGRIQGKTALVQHFQNSSLLHEDKRCRPVLFHTDGTLAGEQEPFPAGVGSPM